MKLCRNIVKITPKNNLNFLTKHKLNMNFIPQKKSYLIHVLIKKNQFFLKDPCDIL